MARGTSGREFRSFAVGFATGALSALLVEALRPRRGFDHTLLRADAGQKVPPVVIVPGILGTQLLEPDGREAWLGLGNMVGAHDIALPPVVPLGEARDRLSPGGLLGVDHLLPRLFGFSEYGDLVELLESAGFVRDTGFRRRDEPGAGPMGAPSQTELLRPQAPDGRRGPGGRAYYVFGYDWRQDIASSARELGRFLDAVAERRGEPEARFTVLGHSMGGLVSRCYLRFGDEAPTGEVTWAGARRIARLVLATAPNGGSLPAFEALLTGSPVGFSTTTLAPSVCATFPSLYALLPPPGTNPLLDARGAPLDVDLLDAAAWEKHGWGPFAAGRSDALRAFARAALARARELREGLDREPREPCPVGVALVGGDTLPTLARGVWDGRGQPRFVPESRVETARMYDAGDGRVTRASLLASHVPAARDDADECGVHEVGRLAFGHGDHHGLFAEPAFQSALLRALLLPRPLLPRER